MKSIAIRVSDILQPVAGTFGVAACHLRTGDEISINVNQVFKSASVIKIPILVELYCRRDEGGISLDEIIEMKNECKVAGSGVLKELHAGLQFTILDLVTLMIIVSDNTATNMLIDRLGTEPVTQRMRSLGLKDTVLARKMYDFEQAALGNENLCTAGDITLLLRLMAEGRISSKSTSMEMLQIMARQQCREKIPLLLPEGVKVANKTGSLTGVTHDVAVVITPEHEYVLSVLTRDVTDMVSADGAIAEASKVIYEHFCS